MQVTTVGLTMTNGAFHDLFGEPPREPDKGRLTQFHMDIAATAGALADGKAVGWMQGRMEFGPRALGARSILSDSRSESMQKTLNLKIKYRESFRPFAPSILREHVADWFEFDTDSPYMLLVADVAKARRLEMTETEHAFHDLTGCPVIVNTSFNVRGEPIVCTPEDAFHCFMGTEMDLLVCGNAIAWKKQQDPSKVKNYKTKYKLDRGRSLRHSGRNTDEWQSQIDFQR